MNNKAVEKEVLIAEYLTGNLSCRKLGIKYGIDFRLIHSWVMKRQGKNRNPKLKKTRDYPKSGQPFLIYTLLIYFIYN